MQGAGHLLDVSHDHAEGEEQLGVVVVVGAIERAHDLTVGVEPQLVQQHVLKPAVAARSNRAIQGSCRFM